MTGFRHLVVALTVVAFSATVSAAAPCSIKLTVHRNGTVDVDGEHYSDMTQLKLRLNEYKERKADCTVHIDAGEEVRFEVVGRVIATLQELGMMKVWSLTESRED
jgi:biopolymer transport protein ExbD